MNSPFILSLGSEIAPPLPDVGPQPEGSGISMSIAQASITVLGMDIVYNGELVQSAVTQQFLPRQLSVLTGPPGVGKSSLLRIIAGLQKPTRGTVLVGAKSLEDLDLLAYQRQISWIPEQPLLAAGTIADNLHLAHPSASDDRVAAVLSRMGLRSLADQPVLRPDAGDEFSCGERQRVALACALLADTPMVLLDEPTADCDLANERIIIGAVRELSDTRTVICATDNEELIAAAGLVVTFSPGRARA